MLTRKDIVENICRVDDQSDVSSVVLKTGIFDSKRTYCVTIRPDGIKEKRLFEPDIYFDVRIPESLMVTASGEKIRLNDICHSFESIVREISDSTIYTKVEVVNLRPYEYYSPNPLPHIRFYFNDIKSYNKAVDRIMASTVIMNKKVALGFASKELITKIGAKDINEFDIMSVIDNNDAVLSKLPKRIANAMGNPYNHINSSYDDCATAARIGKLIKEIKELSKYEHINNEIIDNVNKIKGKKIEMSKLICQNPSTSDFARYALHYNNDPVVNKSGSRNPNIIVMTWDIEVFNIEMEETGKMANPAIPLNEITLIGVTLHCGSDTVATAIFGSIPKAIVYGSNNKILYETAPDLDIISGGKRYEFFENSEAQMLKQFFTFIISVRPDIIIGFNDHEFDWPYLLARMHRCYSLNTELHSLFRQAFNLSKNGTYFKDINYKGDKLISEGEYNVGLDSVVGMANFSGNEEIYDDDDDGDIKNESDEERNNNNVEYDDDDDDDYDEGSGKKPKRSGTIYKYHLKGIPMDMAKIHTVKIDAQYSSNGYIPVSDSVVFIDMRTTYRKYYPGETKTSLNAFLSIQNLGQKVDNCYKEMNIILGMLLFIRTKVLSSLRPNEKYYHAVMDKLRKYINLSRPFRNELFSKFMHNSLYCLVDAAKCYALFKAKDTLTEYIKIAELCRIPLEDAAYKANGMKILNLILEYGKRFDPPYSMRLRVSKRDNELDYAKRNGKNAGKYSGAFVFQPRVGVHYTPIAALDFSSLYPSCMMAFSASPDCIFDSNYYAKSSIELDHDVREPDNSDSVKQFDGVMSNGYITSCHGTIGDSHHEIKMFRFSQPTIYNPLYLVKHQCHKGLIPYILEDLNKLRSQARVYLNQLKHESEQELAKGGEIPTATKVLMNDLNQKQLAIKVLANSCYGLIGATTSGPVCKIELAEVTTKMGQTMLKSVYNYIEQDGKFTVVYGDTDSMYLTPKPNLLLQQFDAESISNNIDITRNMIAELNSRITVVLKTITDSGYLKMAYEEILMPSLFVAKKNYFGIKHENTNLPIEVNDDSLFVRGIYGKRDFAKVAKYIYTEEILKKLLSYDGFNTFARHLENRLAEGRHTLEDAYVLASHDCQRVLIQNLVPRIPEIFQSLDPMTYFAKNIVYRADTKVKNQLSKVFVAKMQTFENQLRPECRDRFRDLIRDNYPVPQNGDRFDIIYIKSRPTEYFIHMSELHDMEWTKLPATNKGPRAEYPRFIRDFPGTELDYDEYYKSMIRKHLSNIVPPNIHLKDGTVAIYRTDESEDVAEKWCDALFKSLDSTSSIDSLLSSHNARLVKKYKNMQIANSIFG